MIMKGSSGDIRSGAAAGCALATCFQSTTVSPKGIASPACFQTVVPMSGRRDSASSTRLRVSTHLPRRENPLVATSALAEHDDRRDTIASTPKPLNSGTVTAPIQATASEVTVASTPFSISRPTRSPRLTPSAFRPPAKPATLRASSA
ncbi:hypothetical protein D9M70_269860 [compost metagenome]